MPVLRYLGALNFARVQIIAGVAAGLFLPVPAWSGVTLSRHTYRAGFIPGVVAGMVMLGLS
jgi:hypothetical protein